MTDSIQGVGSGSGMGAFPTSQPLSADQKSQVHSILSNYDPSKLTTDNARAIFKAFRQDGIKPGKDLFTTLKAAGFDPQQLRALARPVGQSGSPDTSSTLGGAISSGGPSSNSSAINSEMLKMIQSILSQFETATTSSDQTDPLSQDPTSMLASTLSTTGTSSSSTGVDGNLMQMMQSILSQYQTANQSSDQNNDLLSKLTSAGLLTSGSAVNLSA